jgi:hypothetical protein
MASSNRSILPRRIFLRGVIAGGISVAVPLPRLFGMLNGNGTAYADGTALPVRFGSWFFGNGIIPDRWVPKTTGIGNAWELSEQLAPLQAVKPWLSVLTGFAIKIANNAPHASMPSAALSGAQVAGNATGMPTIDQQIAPIVNGSPFKSGLHVGISNTSGATSLGLAISYAGGNSPNSPNFSPAAMFKQLMGYASTTAPGAPPAAPDPELLRRAQVLDAVNADAKALRMRLGTDDQMRLDLHLSGLSELQAEITKLEAPKTNTNVLVDPDKAYPTRGADGAITRLRGQAFSDLLVFAMASDLTRIFSFMFSAPACHGHYDDCGLDASSFHEDFGHRLSSKGASYATIGFNTGVKFAMSNLADTLTKMKATPDGAATLLDNSCVYTTSCVSESQTHGGTDFPLLVAGKAGGKLKGDTHIRLVGENVSKVPFTLLTAMGGNATSFGSGDGLVTSGISEMLAT